MTLHFISNTNWKNFLEYLTKESETYGLVSNNGNLLLENVQSENIDKIVIDQYRSIHPIKNFFFPVKEEVTQNPKDKTMTVLGAKACDLNHIKTMDSIFIGGALVDPYYATKRDNVIIISSDCNNCVSSCFCTLMEGKPYPEQGFDINLSPLGSGFIAEVGTPKGEKVVSQKKELFEEVQQHHIEERDRQRKEITEKVKENNKEFSWSEPRQIVEKHFESSKWKDEVAKTCVECDACRFACGTCYCFLLSETNENWQRIRTWDSCQSAGYARVGGGANPRKKKDERLRNWYMCKLSYRPQNFGFYACTGCGRCIDVCQGKIDIRKSLQKLTTDNRR